MAVRERRPTEAAPLDTSPSLQWKRPDTDLSRKHREHLKQFGLFREPRFIFSSTEPKPDYTFRRDLLIDAMLTLDIPSWQLDRDGLPTVTYHITDLRKLHVGIAEVLMEPAALQYPVRHEFIVYKNGSGPEEDFEGYFNSMLDRANTALVQEKKVPFPKPNLR